MEAAVEGKVSSDSTGDPIDGANVAVFRTDEGEQVGKTTTGTDGTYEVTFSVPESDTPDELRIEADADGFLAAADTIGFDESVTSDLALSEAVQSEVSGQLSNEDTGEGVNGATVTGTDENQNELFETTTDENGQYSASLELAEAPNQITIQAEAEDFEGAEETVQFAEEISQDFALVPEMIDVLIDGTVTSEDDGESIEDATVEGLRLDEEALLADTTTASDGSYELSFTVKAPQAPDDLRIAVSEAFGREDKKRTVSFNSTLTEDFALAAVPIEISTIEELQKIGNESKYPLDRDYVLVNDIDASETETWNDGRGFEPIGDDIASFTGAFDGGGFEIANLTINRFSENDVALFGFLEDGLIENVFLKDVSVTGGTVTGGLVGDNGGLIRDSRVTGSIRQQSINGGIAGKNRGEIRDCHFEGTVSGEVLLGGITGQNSATGGGIVESSASGNMDANGGAAEGTGGLVGENIGLVDASKASADVSGVDGVGGLIGENFTSSAQVRNSYANGEVGGVGEGIGGLVGVNDDGQISESYSAGAVLGDEDIGGLIGTNGGTLSSTFWNTEASGQSDGVGRGDSDGTSGLTTDEMQGESTEQNMEGFDFQDTWQVVTDDYPVLFWENN